MPDHWIPAALRPPAAAHTPSRSRASLASTASSSSIATASSVSISYGDRSQPYMSTVAPTPTNTYMGGDVYSHQSFSQEILNEPHLGGASTGYRPSLSANSSFGGDQSFSSDSPIMSLPSAAGDDESDYHIPFSARNVPAPPLRKLASINAAELASSTTSAVLAPVTSHGSVHAGPLTPSDDSSPLSSFTSGAALHQSMSPRFRWRSKPAAEDPDAFRLQQLGYDPVFGRDYTFWTSLAISFVNIGALQGTVYGVSGCFSYGGPLMLLVAWPLSGIISIPLTLIMSELASAYPVSGAMASWAWKTARGGVGGERQWGWLMGGVVLGGHVGSLVLIAWEASSLITGTIGLALNVETENWQKVCFYLAIVAVVGFIGSTAWGRSPRYWHTAGLYVISIWFILCVTLLATKATTGSSSRSLVSKYYNNTGWSSHSYVYFLGWQYCTIATGFDASAHMSEETQNPSRNVPNAMTVSMVATYLVGYVVSHTPRPVSDGTHTQSILLLLLSINPDDAAVLAEHPFAVGHILESAISQRGAIAICSLLVIAFMIQLQAQLQSASRFVFALARDRAFPFSKVIVKTNEARQPVVANWLVVAMWAACACLLIGSASSLYSVLAVASSSLNMITPVALYIFSKKDLSSEGRASWSLRKWSRPVAVLGLMFGLGVIVSQFVPGSWPVTVATVSWSPVVLVGTGIICFITWRLYGAKNYSGPIRALTKWETGVAIDLDQTMADKASRAAARPETDDSFMQGDGNDVDRSIKDAIAPGLSLLDGPTVTVEPAMTVGSGSDSSGSPRVRHLECVESRSPHWQGHGVLDNDDDDEDDDDDDSDTSGDVRSVNSDSTVTRQASSPRSRSRSRTRRSLSISRTSIRSALASLSGGAAHPPASGPSTAPSSLIGSLASDADSETGLLESSRK